MKKTKQALFQSMIALILCFSMLVGTTFAWFTDEVNSSMNQIVAGNLDVELLANGTKVTDKTELFELEDPNLWEPGMVVYENLTVVNAGTLALKWQMMLNFGNENATEDGHKLSEVLQIAIIDEVAAGTAREAVLAAAKASATKGELSSFFNSGDLAAKTNSETFAVVIFWEPGDNDNRYNLSNGKSTTDGEALHIEFGIRLQATQMSSESDSFGNDYDANAAADIFPGFQGGAGSIPLTLDAEGYTTTEVTYDLGDIIVVIPVGVKLAAGYSSVYASAVVKDTTDTNIQLSGTEQMRPSDVHIEGVAADNTKAMFVTLKHYVTTGLNSGALTLYHVENGVAVPMKHAANPVNHNEFTYDPLTGDVTLALASFSEVAVVADTTNPWDGKTEIAYTGSGTEADPYLIANADQLAYFRTQVDAGKTFAGEFVKLNNNIYLSGELFDPIGWGYVNSSWNRDVDGDGYRDAGKVFQGTFDGNGKTIFGLYQNGWDLDPDKENYSNYTYTNCGFGLFAAASGATFKDLTISGANVVVECVEAGILVGLSQNNCTYENIEIHNSKIANYQRPAGGLIGEVSGSGETIIKNVTIGSDVVVGSLWGDFDAPCGGVIGAYWNDVDTDWNDVNAEPQIVMTNVDVGCRLDVYNDITSAYQWHAYRRAGMLIGNTDMSDPNNAHKAYAPFLKCENVNVYYGDWANYTYCSFSNHNSRYPWVRTQAGENCDAFSNPRWGVPNDANGNRVTDMNHKHQVGDECNVSRPFGQLYGGGQGVYGKDTHPGVEIINYKYSITYINDSQVLDIIYVTDNSKAVDVANDQAQKLVLEWAKKNIQGGTIAFGGWMNAASNKLTEIPANNTKNVVLYPYFKSPYTASFVDQQGNILAWCLFNDSDVTRLGNAFATAKDNLPALEKDFTLINWKISGTLIDNDNDDTNDKTFKVDLANDNTNWESFKGYKDVTITPHYRYNGADLIEVFDELTGEVDHYQVAGYAGGTGSTLVEIPAYVNGKPVTTINADAFSSYEDLHAVVIPKTVTIAGDNILAEDWVTFDSGETITIYYAGSYEEWKAIEPSFSNNWEAGIGDGTRIFFLNGKETVDPSQGYLEYKFFNYIVGKYKKWSDIQSITPGIIAEYTGNCTCDSCKKAAGSDVGLVRPDAAYWKGVTVS